MKDKTRDELKKLLDASDNRAEEAKNKKMQEVAREDEFLKHFRSAAHEIIKPVVDEIAKELKGRGHNLSFSFQEEYQDAEDRVRDPHVLVHFRRTGSEPVSRGNMDTVFTFYGSKGLRKVRLHSSTTNQAGPCGEVSIQEITPDLVETELLKWLRACL